MNQEAHDKLYMRKCFRLAEKGKGFVSPNPLVGAVLVRNGKIVARGYHKQFGGAHAEVECLRNYKGSLSGSTLYVNLEPCSHYGKTPPCTDLLIRRGARRVVVAMRDPNPLVSGKGIATLRRAGIVVTCGTLEQEAKHLNRFFVKHITTRVPYVHVKIAQTIDGFIGRKKGQLEYITSAPSRKLVHQWRTEYDAVLVGAGTVKADNPQLNVRLAEGRDPAIVVLDGRLRVSGKEKVFTSAKGRRVFVCIDELAEKSQPGKVRAMMAHGVTILTFPSQDGRLSLKRVLKTLYEHNTGSILVEGGSQVFNQFIMKEIVDEVSLFIAPKQFGSGVKGLSRKTAVKVGQFVMKNKFASYIVGLDSLTTGSIERV